MFMTFRPQDSSFTKAIEHAAYMDRAGFTKEQIIRSVTGEVPTGRTSWDDAVYAIYRTGLSLKRNENPFVIKREKKPPVCLKCRESFEREGIHNRVCKRCKKGDEYTSGEYNLRV